MKSLNQLILEIEPMILDLMNSDIQEFYIKRPKDFAKYLVTWKLYLKKAYNRYCLLGFKDFQGKKFLDISTGIGFFPYICSEQNTVACTEIAGNFEEWPLSVYQQMHKKLNLSCSYFRINPYELLPIKGQFDVITSFDICWHKIKSNMPRYWEIEEYEFLFQDLISHLTPVGVVYLKFFNSNVVKLIKQKVNPKYLTRITVGI